MKEQKVEVVISGGFTDDQMEKIQDLTTELGKVCFPYGPAISMTAIIAFMTAVIDSCFEFGDKIKIYEETSRHFINQIKILNKERKDDESQNRDNEGGKKKKGQKAKDFAH